MKICCFDLSISPEGRTLFGRPTLAANLFLRLGWDTKSIQDETVPEDALIHLRRLAQPFGDHVIEAAQVFLFADG